MKNKDNKNIDIALEMSLNPLVQREGEAASQILQAYKGVRYAQDGTDLHHLGRSLKQISNYKVNPDYEAYNIKQQSGFSAELVQEERKNKEFIRQGQTKRLRTTDGLGMTNDTRFDHVEVDSNQNIIDNSGSQMKFYGTKNKNGEKSYRVIDKFVKDISWERYEKIDIPREQYQGALEYAKKQEENLRDQAAYLRKVNQLTKADKLENKANKYKEASKRIRQSDVSTKEALLARKNPELFTRMEMIRDINHAGIESAKGTAIFSSTMYSVQNIYAVTSGEKTLDEAITDITKHTIKSATVGYGVGATGSTLKAVMHSSNNELIRQCGNTSLPITIAASAVEVVKSMKRYANSEIDEEELVNELGQKGVGILASGYGTAVGATIGASLGSIVPVIGTATGIALGSFIGSFVGYSSSTVLYQGTLEALKGNKISESRRHIIEKISQEAIALNNFYISKIDEYLKNMKDSYRREICSLFNSMQQNILNNDIEGYIGSIQNFGNYFNLDLNYKTLDEFNMAINSDMAIIL